MPTYDYRCEACGHELEIFQPISEGPKRKCPACGTRKLRRVIGAGAGIIFKGSGFYQTDYRSESYKKGADAAKKESKSPEADSKSKSETKSKTKPKPEKDSGSD